MIAKDSKKFISTLFITFLLGGSLFFQACSSTLDSSVEDKELETEKVSFQVLAKDGVISNGLVYFCSLKKGIIKGPFSTGFNGIASPSFDKSVLDSLDEDDQLYWLIKSTVQFKHTKHILNFRGVPITNWLIKRHAVKHSSCSCNIGSIPVANRLVERICI